MNGGPAAVAVSAGKPYAVMIVELDVDSDRVVAIRVVAKPEKLNALERDWRPR